MIGTIRHRRHWAMVLLLALALAAIVTRALVPAGYMIAAAGDRLAVTLCGSGEATAIDLGDGDHERQPVADGGLCAFAVASISAPPPVGPALAALAVSASASPPASRITARVGQGLAAPPPPARGPPALI